jgi:hypothetical protein
MRVDSEKNVAMNFLSNVYNPPALFPDVGNSLKFIVCFKYI